MKALCVQRGEWFYVVLILSLGFMVMPAYGGLLSKTGSEHGTTTVWLPPSLCTVRIDNRGALTGSCSRISVSHSDPSTFCSKVQHVEILLNSDRGFGNYKVGPTRELNLCNFNVNDAWFEPVFPVVNITSQIADLSTRCSNICTRTGMNGTQLFTVHPLYNKSVILNLGYSNGEHYQEVHDIPPVKLICDPCPQLIVKDSMQLHPNISVTLSSSSIVTSGGIPGIGVNFSNLPNGLFMQDQTLVGRPAPGIYKGTVTVRDNCRSGFNSVTKDFRFDVKDAPRILSFTIIPMTFDYIGGNITVSVNASADVDVAEVRLVIANPDGTRSAVPRIPLVGGTKKDGDWRYSWVMPNNDTTAPKVYGIQASVYDVGGTMTTSQVLSVTVPAKPAGTLRLPAPTGLPRFP